MDPLICELARHLRVADADIKFVKPHEEGHDVILTDGSHILIAPHGDYLLEHELKPVRRLPRWESKPKEASKKKNLSVPEGTSDNIIKWVDEDRDRAETALENERQRAKPRLALIKQLERIADG